MAHSRRSQRNMSGLQRVKRFMAALLASASIMQYTVATNVAYAAGAASASWANSGPVIVDSMNLEMSKELKSLGSGEFELTFTAEGTNTVTYNNETRLAAGEGTYIVYTSGWYQIDLYGGAGGDGRSQSSSVQSSPGGAGGQVHGLVWLEAGQVLHYSLGGNGSRTSEADAGGGANGGGNNGGDGYAVGGGGGYSAVYLTASESTALNTATDYIMIAGGGGGGGSVFFLAGSEAMGGAGGDCNSTVNASGPSTSGVAGIWYAGSNGTSSGGGTGNLGAGGQSAETVPGAGGASERRGGAGGAGYAGGTGGSSDAILGTNAGGGGGGSSFIAAEVNGQAIQKTAAHIADQSPTGGSVSISFLGGTKTGGTGEDSAVANLQAVRFSATISEYFDVEVTAGDVTLSGNTVSGELNLYKQKHTVTLTLTAKYTNTFRGGNNVPLLTDASLTVGRHVIFFDNTADDLRDADKDDDPDCTVTDYANVPLSYEVATTSYPNGTYIITNEDGSTTKKTVKDLYSMPYTTNDFVSSLSYAVYSGESEAAADTPLAVGTYVVALTVTLTDRTPALVGTEVTTATYYGVALVSDSVVTNYAGPPSFTVVKNLTFNEETKKYTFSVNVGGSAAGTVDPIEAELPDAVQITYGTTAYTNENIAVSDDGTVTYTVPKDGYYFIQAWGGDGGKGGDTTGTGWFGEPKDGGIGGYGAYLEGFVYLEAGTKVTAQCGAAGNNGDDADDNAHRGLGGSPTIVEIQKANEAETPILVAGGGGGGGGAKSQNFMSGANKNGLGRTETVTALGNYPDMLLNGAFYVNEDYDTVPETVKDSTVIAEIVNKSSYTTTYTDTTIAEAAGSEGQHGTENANNPKAGNAGISYVNPDYISKQGDFQLSEEAEGIIDTKNFTDARSGYTYGLDTNADPAGYKVTDSDKYNGVVYITCVQIKNDDRYVVDEAGIQTKITELTNQILSYGINAEFSEYFDGFAVSGSYWKPGDAADNPTGTFTPNATWNGKNVTVSAAGAEASLTGRDVAEDTKVATVTVSVNYTVSFTFDPVDGFLGGNDVPVLAEGTVVTMKRSDTESFSLTADSAADYANVALKDVITLSAPTEEIIITCGESIALEDLYAFQTSGTSNAFVNVGVTDVTPSTIAPTETTQYTITAGVVPKDAEKATVDDPVRGLYKSVAATVYVNYKVTASLSNMTSNLPELVRDGDALTGILTENDGYNLPASITVTVGEGENSTQISGYTYDPTSGQLTIPENLITHNVTIEAAAVEKTYDLIFIEVAEDGTETVLTELSKYGLTVGTDINDYVEAAEAYTGSPTEQKDGHSFRWENLPARNGEDPIPMPAGLRVYGGYAPNYYTLTIRYELADGTQLFDPVIQPVLYGTTYSVSSPDHKNYVPDQELVADTMGAADVNITVTYKDIPAGLTVIFRKSDTGEVIDTINRVGTEANLPTVLVSEFPEVEGYAPKEKADITMASGEGSKLVYVDYDPNQYEVSFSVDGATVSTRTVQFNQRYSYDANTGLNTSLPTPYKEGHTFLGWYPELLEDDGIFETEPEDIWVKAEDIVQTASDHTLYAHWLINTYTLTIHYEVAPPGNIELPEDNVIENIPYGAAYSSTPDPIEGYTVSPEEVTGTMGAADETVTVTYTPNKYTLTVNTVDPFGEPVGDGTYTYDVYHNVKFTESAPTIDGYELADANDSINKAYTSDEEVTLVYLNTNATFYVTVTWGDLVYDYSQRSNWDGEKHQYAIPVGREYTGQNFVKVSNNKWTQSWVNVNVSFAPDEGYNMDGYFTSGNDSEAKKEVNDALAAGTEQTYWLSLYGSLTGEQQKEASQVVGNCTVTIRKTDEGG